MITDPVSAPVAPEGNSQNMDEDLRSLIVPLRSTTTGYAGVVLTGCRPAGDRVGIAFSTPDRLVAAMGPSQPWIRLSELALRAMLRPLGICDVERDPIMVGPRVSVPPHSQPARRSLATAGTSRA